MKYVVRGKLKNKQTQFTRNTLEDARGIAENLDTATIYKKTPNGLIPREKLVKGIIKPLPISMILSKARKLANKKTR